MTKYEHKQKLSNYLLDKRLQLRYVAFVSALSAILCGSLGYLIYQQEREASERIAAAAESPMFADDPELISAITDNLATGDHNLLLTMAAVGVGLVIVLSLYLIVMTHRVAGPLYNVSRYFARWEEGVLGEVYHLRRGDMLKSFYDNFRETHEIVRDRHRATNEVAGRFLDACSAAGVTPDGELGEALARFRDYHERRVSALS